MNDIPHILKLTNIEYNNEFIIKGNEIANSFTQYIKNDFELA